MVRALRRCLVLASVSFAGCYTYRYAPEHLTPGTQVAIDLNDAGRVQMGNNVGPEVARIEGALAAVSDSEMTLRVERTIDLRGQIQHWAGEQVLVHAGWYRLVLEKKFSRPRTVALVGSLTAGFVAFMASRGLIGFGNGGDTGKPIDPQPH